MGGGHVSMLLDVSFYFPFALSVLGWRERARLAKERMREDGRENKPVSCPNLPHA